MNERPAATSQSLRAALRSWRIGAVTLLSFSSGLPLGVVLTAVPTWLAVAGVDIKTIGILTLAQAPYAFKFAWAPLVDRFPIPGLGRKRGWILAGQLALGLLTFGLAVQATEPTLAAVAALTLLIALASATQDIAVDAYAVDVLEAHEQGLAVGARTALYRVAMWVSGPIAISLSQVSVGGRPLGWGVTLGLLGATYLALIPVSLFAPEPQVEATPRTLREAVLSPLVGFLRKSRALEIAAFLLFYKLADNLAVALVRPFLVQQGYSAFDVGVASGTIGLLFTLVGTFLGGLLTQWLGVGRSLWVFGLFQAVSNLGYALVASSEVSRPLMYAAMALDAGASGMGTGAFGVFLLRLTEKRFSATQYALFSSLFALGRTLVGPLAGSLAAALGWRDFFVVTVAAGIPGLVLLQRFVPWWSRDIPTQDVPAAEAPPARVLSRGALWLRGLAGGVLGLAAGMAGASLLTAIKQAREGAAFDWAASLGALLVPADVSAALDLAGALLLAALTGATALAWSLQRRG